jgi:hypothetical protein
LELVTPFFGDPLRPPSLLPLAGHWLMRASVVLDGLVRVDYLRVEDHFISRQD